MKKVVDFEIVHINQLQDSDFELYVQSIDELENILPGQFVNILIPHTDKTYLRRPISVCDVDYEKKQLHFYIRKVGNGTQTLSQMKVGDKLNILYPLGNSFSVTAQHPLLIGGGCGIAPLVYLAKQYVQKGIKPTILLGGKSIHSLTLQHAFVSQAEIYLSTEDGSCGEKGLLIYNSIMKKLSTFDIVQTCGPEVMMKAIAKMSAENNVKCEVSLENTMACGLGACLCCVTKTKRGNECVCTNGPIFDSKELINFI